MSNKAIDRKVAEALGVSAPFPRYMEDGYLYPDFSKSLDVITESLRVAGYEFHLNPSTEADGSYVAVVTRKGGAPDAAYGTAVGSSLEYALCEAFLMLKEKDGDNAKQV